MWEKLTSSQGVLTDQGGVQFIRIKRDQLNIIDCLVVPADNTGKLRGLAAVYETFAAQRFARVMIRLMVVIDIAVFCDVENKTGEGHES